MTRIDTLESAFYEYINCYVKFELKLKNFFERYIHEFDSELQNYIREFGLIKHVKFDIQHTSRLITPHSKKGIKMNRSISEIVKDSELKISTFFGFVKEIVPQDTGKSKIIDFLLKDFSVSPPIYVQNLDLCQKASRLRNLIAHNEMDYLDVNGDLRSIDTQCKKEDILEIFDFDESMLENIKGRVLINYLYIVLKLTRELDAIISHEGEENKETVE